MNQKQKLKIKNMLFVFVCLNYKLIEKKVVITHLTLFIILKNIFFFHYIIFVFKSFIAVIKKKVYKIKILLKYR